MFDVIRNGRSIATYSNRSDAIAHAKRLGHTTVSGPFTSFRGGAMDADFEAGPDDEEKARNQNHQRAMEDAVGGHGLSIAGIRALLDWAKQQGLSPDQMTDFEELINHLSDDSTDAEDAPSEFEGGPRVGSTPYGQEQTPGQALASGNNAEARGAQDARTVTLQHLARIGVVGLSYSPDDVVAGSTAMDRMSEYLRRKGLSAQDVTKARQIVTRKAMIAMDRTPVRVASFAERNPDAAKVGFA